MIKLPIESVLNALKDVLSGSTSAVLVAQPGAGKTTRVPLALMDEPWLAGRKIVMLEPRRLAARSAAQYMAAALGERVGETVGYRVRLDTKVGPGTRIEVITEGVLTRLLQEDPSLEGVGLVIFDEFHERSLHADLGLALCIQAQQVFREELRLLVMSATLEAEPVAALLGDAPVIRSEGRSYAVETRYLERPVADRMEPAVVQAVMKALESDEGDLLVFLPGAAEIRRVAARLAELLGAGAGAGAGVRIAPLYGQLTQAEQDAALKPCGPGERKVVLATSIAETSLTVEGVRVVVDSGWMRVPRFSPRTGMTRLETVRVSRASADQRRGRAGRLAAGVCYRLWTVQEDRQLAERSTPEVLEADLTALALELAAWGVSDPLELQWLDPPPGAAMSHARELLGQLGALAEGGGITAHGRAMAELGLHPRLAHMLLQAAPLRLGGLASELAAILSSRDFLRSASGAADSDLRLRVEALRGFAATGRQPLPGYTADAGTCRQLLAEARQFRAALAANSAAAHEARDAAGTGSAEEIHAAGLLLAFAYPDRIAAKRPNGRYLLSSGRGAALPDAGSQPISSAVYLVAAELDDQGAESRIYLASPVALEELEQHCSELLERERSISWDRSAGAVRARQRLRLGAIVLQEKPLASLQPDELQAALLQGIAEEGLGILPWTRASRQLQHRASFMHRADPSWPDWSDEALLGSLADWLGPQLYGLRSRDDLQRLNLTDILENRLTWDQRRELDVSVPTHIVVPSGSRIPVDYSDPAAPVLAVRLQELFGLQETPKIARRTVPVTLHLLSPAHRPVQVTKDLASFWQNAYFEVKKDLKGRYPKHHWPDDPLSAIPTNRAKPRS
ncbi:ATP-dependent helicase HrpB [Paenibacillus cremeus]|uniref:ATP-dependent helicase HrpB n=1 Tax=Paenibacillus cremeus TaxID=2163881 RepID=A0A559KEM5_9BACL|nr:ATP-dependent helicase HrpB [Paenibacillus cremeus]TVY10563.1 ATP-dependent helicase HrpB [Paenibacillus cremeus]